MSSERDKILSMIEEGTITAEEANELLEAIPDDNVPDEPDPANIAEYPWPDVPARGQAWRKPFTLALSASVFSSTLLLRTRNASGLIGFVHRFVFWPLTIFSAIAALVTFFSKDSPWLHVRVQSDDDQTFVISLPFPAKALSKALEMASAQAPSPDVQEKIDAAAEILAEMDTSNLKDPIMVDINDEGDSVQVYLN